MFKTLLDNVLIFTVLLNPISKIILLASIEKEITVSQLKTISKQATITAICILIAFAFAGLFILNSMFHIRLSSLRIVGGIVLFMIGLRALQKGEFFEPEYKKKTDNIAVVPIASPLIAGPATITAAITQSAIFNPYTVSIAIVISSLINYLFMVYSFKISKALRTLNLTNPLIRITGLMIASIGVDMAFSGIEEFFHGVKL